MPSPGWKFCSFRCAQDDVPLVMERLRAFDEVEPGTVRPTATGVAFTIDVARLHFNGDGPAAELRITRALDLVVSRKRLPTDPPAAK